MIMRYLYVSPGNSKMFVLHIWSYVISYINAHNYANVLLDCIFYEYAGDQLR